jgi:hypothetical protein
VKNAMYPPKAMHMKTTAVNMTIFCERLMPAFYPRRVAGGKARPRLVPSPRPSHPG